MFITLFLDTRRPSDDPSKLFSIRLRISQNSTWRAISTGIKVRKDDWDAKYAIVKPSVQNSRQLNSTLSDMLDTANSIVTECVNNNILNVPIVAERVRGVICPKAQARKAQKLEEDTSLLLTAFDRFIDTKNEGGTKRNYILARRRIVAFLDGRPSPRLDNITPAWLKEFDGFMALTAPSANARSVNMRCLRAVINYAIEMEWTSNYPFRRFRIKSSPTRHRVLEVDELKRLLTMDVDDIVRPYRDFFLLSFLLIGMNPIDLLSLSPNSVIRGRIQYTRRKTHKLYDIKVEPEAIELINHYKGKNRLWGHADNYVNPVNYEKRVNSNLSKIGTCHIGKHGKKTYDTDYEDITLYWARHTWATIAASLDIPKETIAQALGHSSNSVTDVYIKFDRRKVDEANRRVIDWVLYGKK